MTVAASIFNSEDFFTASLFQEFEANLDTVFGFSYADLKTTLDRAGTQGILRKQKWTPTTCHTQTTDRGAQSAIEQP